MDVISFYLKLVEMRVILCIYYKCKDYVMQWINDGIIVYIL